MPSPAPAAPKRRVLIAGSGTAGRTLAADAAAAGEVVVGYLDDIATGPDVLGRLSDVADVVHAQAVDIVYFAIPSASADVFRDFVGRVPRPDVELAVVPRTYRIVSRERVSVADLTDVDVLDFVGRAPVKHDMMLAREVIQDRRVLVTGAGGSIGSRLVSQLLTLDPAVVVGVDRSEPAIFHLGQSLQGMKALELQIADVQSAERMGRIMDEVKPDLVFHVAAYKHVPLMESHPVEAFNNNVGGTLNVFEQAVRVGVDRVVYVSTDKAVHPTNVMGATKRLGELLLADMVAGGSRTKFSGVRFGNVLESEGSVMQTFRRQIQRKQNLTVTHPDITRYFMTIDEAAQLVIQTATTGRQGDLFVLDMGEPIRVYDLAQSLIHAVDPSLGIDIVGLRPGEKMFEELTYRESSVDKTTHPKIFVLKEENEHAPGEALRWARGLLGVTRSYKISDEALRAELRSFGFSALR